VVRLLLNREGIDVDCKDQFGQTPLVFAVGAGDETAVELLLEHKGIDTNARDDISRTLLS
jgi:ankyrin repeat protein